MQPINLCSEVMSWIIEIWTENHLVSDIFCNIVNIFMPEFFLQEWQRMLDSIVFGDGDTYMCGLQVVLSKTKRIDNTNFF